jgi:hypothetical protein
MSEIKELIAADIKRLGFGAWAKAVLAAGRTRGLVLDEASRGALEMALEWHQFTVGWVAERRRKGLAAHHCALAVAMASADYQQQTWDYYLRQAHWHLRDVFEREMVAARWLSRDS